MNEISVAQLVAIASMVKQIPCPGSLARRLEPSSHIWPAEVVARWESGCHVRVAGEHDTVLPVDALPPDTDHFGLRINVDGLVILPAA